MEGAKGRTVHAWGEHAEVVRYNKAGKWYIEPKNKSLPRQAVTVDEAVDYAIWLWYHDEGTVDFGQPGGSTFDRKVRARV